MTAERQEILRLRDDIRQRQLRLAALVDAVRASQGQLKFLQAQRRQQVTDLLAAKALIAAARRKAALCEDKDNGRATTQEEQNGRE